MKIVGHVESLWRYPVKSMRGEQLQAAFVGFPGIYGDRLYAFRSSAAPKGFPYLTGREQQQLLRCRPRFRDPERMMKPSNLSEAEALAPGVTPLYASPSELALDVETPDGQTIPIDDPRLVDMLRKNIRDVHELTLIRSDRALTDCRPISLFSIQTARRIGEEVGTDIDKRRFRSNVYLELVSKSPFGEDEFVGGKLQIGAKTVIAVTDRDPRCKMITLDSDTGVANPDVMRHVARDHEGKAGIYGAVVVEGTIRPGDEITLLS
jgi:MOSC domain-containing protein